MDSASHEEMLLDSGSSQGTLQSDASVTSLQDILLDASDNASNVEDSDHDSDSVLFDDSSGPLAGEDVLLLSRDVDSLTHASKDRSWVATQIEETFDRIRQSMASGDDDMSILLRSAPRHADHTRKQELHRDYKTAPKIRKISFPGKTAEEAWQFTVLVRILELIHTGLTEGMVMTKRDIYYRQPDLFLKQAVVDRYVDDVARTFGVPRALLNVTAAAKGLAAGNFSIRRPDGVMVSGLEHKDGLLIPEICAGDAVDFAQVRWILMIEKEAAFSSLVHSPQWSQLRLRGIAITAKGYPDLASREFLRQLADRSACVPMYALMDYDPDGIAILSTYKYGSARLAHEHITTSGAISLSLPEIRWLGIHGHHIRQAWETSNASGGNVGGGNEGCMRLTTRDRAKACQMLEWEVCAEGGGEPAWRRELQAMLMLNIKAEMQIVDECPGGIPLWLERELAKQPGLHAGV